MLGQAKGQNAIYPPGLGKGLAPVCVYAYRINDIAQRFARYHAWHEACVSLYKAALLPGRETGSAMLQGVDLGEHSIGSR
ncbi:hypothetical protein D3C78_638930 [compost metagenome]